jgi:hypothetical protein
VILRFGDDEFLCAMPNSSAPEARTRFLEVELALGSINTGHEISFGLSQAQPGETLEALFGRARPDLRQARGTRDDPT